MQNYTQYNKLMIDEGVDAYSSIHEEVDKLTLFI